ncbi:MAG: NfeD family protein [Clostridia bacterium]|nr:NfeD family protein [Clostridia bacterium]
MSPIIIWTVVCVACLVFEFVTAGEFVTIWFALGAVVTVICSCFNANFTVRIIVFLSVSLASLIIIRPICMKALKKSEGNTNLDTIKGQKVRIIEPVLEDKMGTAKINDIVWNCVSENDEEIASGTVCTIVEIKGNKLVVKPNYQN